MIRTALVVVHASAGIGGLITGLPALIPPVVGHDRRWMREAYVACLAILLTSMIALVTIDWNDLDAAGRIAFLALIGLGAIVGYRLARAHREAALRRDGWRERYVDHVYFTYISLWEGFVILPALNLPLPQVSVPLAAGAVLLIGHTSIARFRARVVADQRPVRG